jgi:sugar phosphate isomerase/epimerase
LRLQCVIETGARFLLNPLHKHQPTLLTPQPEARAHRVHFLQSAIRIGQDLNASAISFWSGTPLTQNEPASVLFDRLSSQCQALAQFAQAHGQRLAFEPEPGMFIDTMDAFDTLFHRVNHPAFGLTIDLGHLHCQGELPTTPHLLKWRDKIWNIHVEGMRQGIHEHLQLDEGDFNLPEALSGLKSAGYKGALHLELSRHGHDAVNAATKAKALLRSALAQLR